MAENELPRQIAAQPRLLIDTSVLARNVTGIVHGAPPVSIPSSPASGQAESPSVTEIRQLPPIIPYRHPNSSTVASTRSGLVGTREMAPRLPPRAEPRSTTRLDDPIPRIPLHEAPAFVDDASPRRSRTNAPFAVSTNFSDSFELTTSQPIEHRLVHHHEQRYDAGPLHTSRNANRAAHPNPHQTSTSSSSTTPLSSTLTSLNATAEVVALDHPRPRILRTQNEYIQLPQSPGCCSSAATSVANNGICGMRTVISGSTSTNDQAFSNTRSRRSRPTDRPSRESRSHRSVASTSSSPSNCSIDASTGIRHPAHHGGSFTRSQSNRGRLKGVDVTDCAIQLRTVGSGESLIQSSSSAPPKLSGRLIGTHKESSPPGIADFPLPSNGRPPRPEPKKSNSSLGSSFPSRQLPRPLSGGLLSANHPAVITSQPKRQHLSSTPGIASTTTTDFVLLPDSPPMGLRHPLQHSHLPAWSTDRCPHWLVNGDHQPPDKFNSSQSLLHRPSLPSRKAVGSLSLPAPASPLFSALGLSDQLPSYHSRQKDTASSSIICRDCGKCRCRACSSPKPLPSCWICCGSCLCSSGPIIDALSCMCCVKATVYHATGERMLDSRHGNVFLPSVRRSSSLGRKRGATMTSKSQLDCAGNKGGDTLSSGAVGTSTCTWIAFLSACLFLPCMWCYYPLKGIELALGHCYARARSRGCNCHGSSLQARRRSHSSPGSSRLDLSSAITATTTSPFSSHKSSLVKDLPPSPFISPGLSLKNGGRGDSEDKIICHIGV